MSDDSGIWVSGLLSQQVLPDSHEDGRPGTKDSLGSQLWNRNIPTVYNHKVDL